MGKSLFNSEFTDVGEDYFDPDEDSMPSDILVLKRCVNPPSGPGWTIEAHITRSEGDEKGVTWIKLYDTNSSNFSHCYVDTMDPELILNAMENYILNGRGVEVEAFLREEGRVAKDPVVFRMKMENVLGSPNGNTNPLKGMF